MHGGWHIQAHSHPSTGLRAVEPNTDGRCGRCVNRPTPARRSLWLQADRWRFRVTPLHGIACSIRLGAAPPPCSRLRLVRASRWCSFKHRGRGDAQGSQRTSATPAVLHVLCVENTLRTARPAPGQEEQTARSHRSNAAGITATHACRARSSFPWYHIRSATTPRRTATGPGDCAGRPCNPPRLRSL
jgi:hypothetical protein